MTNNLIARLRKVEPDTPGERTRWYRNPDGPEAADEIERLRITDEEREAIGVAIQCVEASRAQRHPDDDARDLLWETSLAIRLLLERTA